MMPSTASEGYRGIGRGEQGIWGGSLNYSYFYRRRRSPLCYHNHNKHKKSKDTFLAPSVPSFY